MGGIRHPFVEEPASPEQPARPTEAPAAPAPRRAPRRAESWLPLAILAIGVLVVFVVSRGGDLLNGAPAPPAPPPAPAARPAASGIPPAKLRLSPVPPR